jgi:hypothetical protein
MKYEIYTKKVRDEWVKDPVLLITFYSKMEAIFYLENYAKKIDNPLAKSICSESISRYFNGKCNTFGVGAIRFCKVREI